MLKYPVLSSFTQRLVLFLALLTAALPITATTAASKRARTTLSFDANWRFLKGDAPGAENPSFDDAAWRTLNVPHDWSIEGPFDQNNPTGRGGGYLPAGVGWYRKQFTLPSDYARRSILIDFDSVMANSDVWINGFHLGKRPYGYVSFRYILTGHLHFGENQLNILAVRADNSAQPASRWYSGAGIYRHVRLVVTNPVHIHNWGVFVTTPQISDSQATVHVQTAVANQSNESHQVRLQTTILAPDGQALQTAEARPKTIPPGKSVEFLQDFIVKNPQHWDLDHPLLYRAITRVRAASTTLDDEVTPFGIRKFHFDAATGFWLNGSNIKLKGVCLHQDAGGLGAAVPLGAWERRFKLLKQFGVNAIRTSHNPAAPEFLDLCDRMGFLVMDEMFDCWTVGKNPYDYHLYFNQWSQTDLQDSVRRDRNHPSIILYSAGNEIHDTPNAVLARRILTSLRNTFHKVDPTRPVTMALFRPNQSHDYENGLADLLDVIGTNYRDKELLAAHQARPQRKILGTENAKSRGVWLDMRDNPSFSGQFLWSGIDYLGESAWPKVGDGSGLFDRTGSPRPIAYEFQSYWTGEPMVHIARADGAPAQGSRARSSLPRFSNWTPWQSENESGKTESNPEGSAAQVGNVQTVEVYSNCQQVELVLNGKSLGSQPRPPDDAPRTWKVPFQPGVIQALGKNGGQVAATDELHTASKPARIILTTDHTILTPDWDDVAYITATVTDENGVPNPWATDLVTFHLTGAGAIAAVDNGDNFSHEPFQAFQRRAFQGQCIAILKATAPAGQIILSASAPGLTGSSIIIQAAAPSIAHD